MSAFEEIEVTSLVLVAIVPDKKDLEIARLLGWYRIPLKNAPKVIAVDYLALYQTGNFGANERWQVKWLAPIIGHELTTRRQLFRDQPDHPRANEEYFKLQLGSLIALPKPIPAGTWKRVTFFYTTMRHVREANELGDLPVHDQERPVLWAALRERASHAESYHAAPLPEIPLDPALLAMLSGIASAKK